MVSGRVFSKRSRHVAWLLTTTAAIAAGIIPATAQQDPKADRVTVATSATYQFDIPAKTLAAAIADVGAVSGWRIAYPFTLPANARSKALSGSMAPPEAVGRLLAGTGLSLRVTGAQSIVLVDPKQQSANGTAATVPGAIPLDTINVQGAPSGSIFTSPAPYAGGQVATGGQLGVLGNRNVMDTPFNITNYTSKFIEDRQARSISDVLSNDPSIRSTGVPGGYIDYVFIRGFEISNGDVTYNGLPGILPHEYVSPDYLERVEVLKGASALLYGVSPSGAIGGAINAVPKHATDEPITRVTTTYSSNSEFGTHLDYGRRFGDNKEWGIRFNGTIQGGDKVSDNSSEKLGDAVLGLDYRGDRFRFSFDGGYANRRLDGYYDTVDFLSNDFKVPSAPKGSQNAFPGWTNTRIHDLFGMARAEYDIAPNWTVFGAVGARQNRMKLLGGIELLQDSAGDFTYFPRAFGVSNDAVSGVAGVRGNFDTGPVNHQVALSANFAQYRQGSLQNVYAAQQGNLYNSGTIIEPDIGNFDYPAPKSAVTDHESIALADTLSILDNRVQLTLGGRVQRIKSTNYDTTTGAMTNQYDKSVFTPAVGLVVKPWENVSVYANYIEGLQPGVTVPITYANYGQVLPPYVSKQIETGVKVDWGRFTTTASVFQITQPSGTADPTTNIFSADGEQRNRGVEFNMFGELTLGLRLLGGVAFIDGRLTKTSSPLTQGKKPYGVPDVQANLGAEWDTPFIHGLTLTGRVVYTSSQYVNQTNTQSIPAWTRVDLGARYVWERPGGKPITFRADVINVANKNYWAAYSFSNSLVQGAPRTFLLSAAIDF